MHIRTDDFELAQNIILENMMHIQDEPNIRLEFKVRYKNWNKLNFEIDLIMNRIHTISSLDKEEEEISDEA